MPPGLAPDWLLIEGLRSWLFGRLTEQHEEDLADQWDLAMERLSASPRFKFYRISRDGERTVATLPTPDEFAARLGHMRFIWDEPGPFGERLFVSSWDIATADFYDPRFDEDADDLASFEEDVMGTAVRRRGGRPNRSDSWLEQYERLFPNGKDSSTSWKAVAAQISDLVGHLVKSKSLQEAARKRRRTREKVNGVYGSFS